MLPAERRQMGQQVIGDIFGLAQVVTARSRYRVFHRMIAVTMRFSPEARCCWFS